MYTIIDTANKKGSVHKICKVICNICTTKIFITSENRLSNIGTLKCPCKKILFWPGDKIKRLTIIEEVFNIKVGGRKYRCLCDCGKEVIVYANALDQGSTTSCGCYNKEVHSTHNLTNSPEYGVYRTMLGRCTNPNHSGYEKYGECGILVDPSWVGPGGFEKFYSDMGTRPSNKHTLERIFNDEGYSPDNCRWATQTEQNRNYSQNVIGSEEQADLIRSQYKTKKFTQRELAKIHNCSHVTIHDIVTNRTWN